MNILRLLTLVKIIITPLFLMFSLSALAQSAPERAEAKVEIKALEIGDTIPNALWDMSFPVVNDPNGKSSIKLEDYKNEKLIVLDFWATWCGSCVGSIKRFMASDNYNNPNLAYYCITYQDHQEIDKFEKRYALRFPSIINDTLLKKYFPHRILPHLVIIKDKKLLATAGPEILEGNGIVSLLKNKIREIDYKADILDFDAKRSFIDQKNEKIKGAILFRSAVTGAIAGMSGSNTYSINGNEQKILLTGKSFQEALYLLTKSYWHNRIFLKVKDISTKDYFNAYKGEMSFGQWINKYGLGVEAYAPLNMPRDKFFFKALLAICNAYDLSLTVEAKELSCYSISKIKSVHSDSKTGIELSDLLTTLNYQEIEKPRTAIYVAEKGIDPKTKFNIDQRTLEQYLIHKSAAEAQSYLRKVLETNGYGIKYVKRLEPVIVISERRDL